MKKITMSQISSIIGAIIIGSISGLLALYLTSKWNNVLWYVGPSILLAAVVTTVIFTIVGVIYTESYTMNLFIGIITPVSVSLGCSLTTMKVVSNVSIGGMNLVAAIVIAIIMAAMYIYAIYMVVLAEMKRKG